MIMQRPDSDNDNDDTFDLFPAPPESADCVALAFEPGFLYRGVPQDVRRRSLRIDTVRSEGAALTGPTWILARRSQRGANLSELFFG